MISASPPRPVLRDALAGVLAAAAALAAGELVAGLVRGARSLVIAVGDQVIDLVPSAVKEAAIAIFGTADKVALLVGIAVVLGLVAAGIGVAAGRRRAWGALGVGAFGLVGAVAAANQTVGAPVAVAVLPAVAATAAGLAALAVLVPRPRRTPAAAAAAVGGPAGAGGPATAGGGGAAAGGRDRRAFLRAAGVVAVLAVSAGTAGRLLQRGARATAARTALALPRPARPLAPVPAAVTVGVDGMPPFVTPNADFYRIDTALQVPDIALDTYRLRVTGLVDRPLELTLDDLLAMDLVEADITLTCVSNEVGGRLLGTARWLGVRLADVLDRAGVRGGATQVVGRSVDGYTCGFPVEAALDGRDALVAVGMNGVPLPREHGFPVRLVTPGLYGYVSATKWLTELELTTFDAFDHYWVGRGWAVQAPIKTQSRIDVPASFARVAPGPAAVAGVAWAQTRGIDRVEVQVDDGPWRPARLAAALNDVTWRQWSLEWDATPGTHQLRVRATDATGATQPEERVAPIPDGATGWHTVVVRVDEV